MNGSLYAFVAIFTALNMYTSSQFVAIQHSDRDCHPLARRHNQHVTNDVGRSVDFLITGCPRSGTRFIAKFLSLNEMHVDHEGFRETSLDQPMSKSGIVSWPMTIFSNSSPWGPPASHFAFKHVLHQVRHPLGTISSLLRNEKQSSWDYICHHVPEITNCQLSRNMSALGRAAEFWVYWNLRAESIATLTYKMESVTTAATRNKIESALQLPLGRLAVYNMSERELGMSKARESRASWALMARCLSEELFDKVLCLAERYGYDVRQPRKLQQEQRQEYFNQTSMYVSDRQFQQTQQRAASLWVRLCCNSLHAANRAHCTF